MRPPPSKKPRITSAHAPRATGSLPTLKVIQLPSPTTGIASPLEGIGRVRIGPRCAHPLSGQASAPAPTAVRARSTLRRWKFGASRIEDDVTLPLLACVKHAPTVAGDVRVEATLSLVP